VIVQADALEIPGRSKTLGGAEGELARIVETKFAGYIGVPKGDALKNTMELKTSKGVFTVERIAQVEATEVIFETVQSGQITVPLADIQEIKLILKPA